MNTSRDRSFPEKFKSFFKTWKGNNTAPQPRRSTDEYLILTEELEAELKPQSPLGNRLKGIKELTEAARVNRAEANVTEKLWVLVNDILRLEKERDARHAVFDLLIALCHSHNGAMRGTLFAFVKQHNHPEDMLPRFFLLQAVTNNGKDVRYFEERMGPLLHDWIGVVGQRQLPAGEFMKFLANVLRFNYTFVDEDILFEIIQNVCIVSCMTADKEVITECLGVLNVILGYGKLPTNCLPNFVATLCRIVNVESVCPSCWKTMRNLLGTHLGHSAVFTMCNFMESSDKTEDVSIIRGAVFFVGASLWGTKTVRSLKYSANAVLMSFDKALNRRKPLVVYEVLLRVQDLIRSNAEGLQSLTWDLILQIIRKALNFAKNVFTVDTDPVAHNKLMNAVSDALDAVEDILHTKNFCGQEDKFYELNDSCYLIRPIPSVVKLMKYKVDTQLHTGKPHWFRSLVDFADKHLRQEIRPAAKAKAMELIARICLANRDIYEEDLIKEIILPHSKNLDSENEPTVRVSGVSFLVDFLMESCSKKGHDLLNILDKIINRPYEIHAQTGADTVHIYSETEVDDILRAVEGIVRIFQRKIYHLPSSIAVSAYKSLVRHLTNHYKKPVVLENCYHIRYKIFQCFFEIRANSLYHLGFPDPKRGLTFSSYLAVDHRDIDDKVTLDQIEATNQHQLTQNSVVGPGLSFNSSSGANAGVNIMFISLTAACKSVVECLKKEKDWNVLELVLKSLPTVLENKALILSKQGIDIDYLANALCAMITDRNLNLPESLRNCPQNPKLSKTDFQAYLYPIFTALVSYHSYLESSTQQRIVKCLQQGLVTKSCRTVILALTICALEMKDTMHKLLPEVLLALSKISAKMNIAISVLEFLSTLIHLPRVFASFVQDQYMSIFAIALPYTNPFKFNQYIVSLAHHVIAMWFLKCRLPFRRQFVSYIIKGLEANVWGPMEEESRRYAMEQRNEDSSNRKRSSSLTERRPDQRKDRSSQAAAQSTASQQRLTFDPKSAADKSLQTFHHELTETCLDFMNRYAFADCSALPTRFTGTKFLIEGGISQSWLVDNRIITITTSGCTQKELKDGLCDKCFTTCRKHRTSEESKSQSSDPIPLGRSLSTRETQGNSENNLAKRRRHFSEFANGRNLRLRQHNNLLGGPLSEGSRKVKDDLHLEQKSSATDVGPGTGFEETNMAKNPLCASSPFIADVRHKTKNDFSLCTCWCAGWAEILIRSPSGNTSWMMRVQNNLGNYNNNNSDAPVKDLSAVYLQNVIEPLQAEKLLSSNTSSTLSSPTSSQQQLLTSQKSLSQESALDGTSGTVSPNAPGSPTSPDSSEEVDHLGRKHPVRRSNSSPEMSTTWKPFNVQKDIEEQDEDENALAASMTNPVEPLSDNPLPLLTENTQLHYITSHRNESGDKENPITLPGGLVNAGSGSKGSTSPFRRSYEAIPEESYQRSGSLTGSPEALQNMEALNPMKRDRVSTISVMTPARRNQMRRLLSLGSGESIAQKDGCGRPFNTPEPGVRSGFSPGFVFLQLCAQGTIRKGDKDDRPIPLPQDDTSGKSLRVLDLMVPYETHKVGVVYIGPGQTKNEAAILQNQHGSARYCDFLQGLGQFIRLKDIEDPQKVYIGGLSRDGEDGEFACFWQDDVMQVIFHAATLMPNKPQDPQGTCKKRHIGNDYVGIVYNNSEEDFDMSTIKAQFLNACVIIQPLDHRTNRVVVKALPNLADLIAHTEPKIVSDQNLPTMARQLALHANLASVIFQKMQTKNTDPYASNWLERLRHIKRLRSRLLPDNGLSNSDEVLQLSFSRRFEDFTEFV